MVQGSVRFKFLAVGVWVEADEDEIVTGGHDKIVVANVFVVVIIANVCVFICLDRQHCVVDMQTMVDTSTVGATSPSVVCPVVDKPFKYTVNGLTHYGLATL